MRPMHGKPVREPTRYSAAITTLIHCHEMAKWLRRNLDLAVKDAGRAGQADLAKLLDGIRIEAKELSLAQLRATREVTDVWIEELQGVKDTP